MKISAEAEKYADEIFFNKSRVIYEDAKKALLEHKFVSHEDTAQTDYSLQMKAAAKMGAARMESYATAYEYEGETVEHEDVLEFIKAGKRIIERQSNMIATASGGIITMVRNQWSADYREQMLTLFRERAFRLMEPAMNELILKSKEAPLKKALRKKMSNRNELFRWIYDQCHGKQHKSAHLRKFLEARPEWTEDDLGRASDYLAGEGLVEQKDDSGLMVWLTHEGVKAGSSPDDIVEGSNRPAFIQHTQHVNTFHGPVGAVQQGDRNIANVEQRVGANMAEVAELLKQLREQMRPDDQETGIEYIDALEDELKKDVPKESRIRLFLKEAGGFATEAGKAVVGELAKKLLLGEISL